MSDEEVKEEESEENVELDIKEMMMTKGWQHLENYIASEVLECENIINDERVVDEREILKAVYIKRTYLDLTRFLSDPYDVVIEDDNI